MTIKTEKFFVDGKETERGNFLYYKTEDGRSLSCYHDWIDSLVCDALDPLKQYADQLISLPLQEDIEAASVGVVIGALVKKAENDFLKWVDDITKHIGRPGIKRLSYDRSNTTANDPMPEHPVGVSFIQYEKEVSDAD